MKIAKIIGREVLDSRGNPTVEVDVELESGNGDNLVDILKSARAKKQRYVCPVPEGMEIPKN